MKEDDYILASDLAHARVAKKAASEIMHPVARSACITLHHLIGELERRLVGLGAAVAQERRAQALGRDARERLDGRRAGVAVDDVAEEQQAAGLRLDGRHDARVAVAGQRDGVAAVEVEVLAAVGVPHLRACAADDRERQLRTLNDNHPDHQQTLQI